MIIDPDGMKIKWAIDRETVSPEQLRTDTFTMSYHFVLSFCLVLLLACSVNRNTVYTQDNAKGDCKLVFGQPQLFYTSKYFNKELEVFLDSDSSDYEVLYIAESNSDVPGSIIHVISSADAVTVRKSSSGKEVVTSLDVNQANRISSLINKVESYYVVNTCDDDNSLKYTTLYAVKIKGRIVFQYQGFQASIRRINTKDKNILSNVIELLNFIENT
jgi:hypothetical protein